LKQLVELPCVLGDRIIYKFLSLAGMFCLTNPVIREVDETQTKTAELTRSENVLDGRRAAAVCIAAVTLTAVHDYSKRYILVRVKVRWSK
jgi:hypothetical protein